MTTTLKAFVAAALVAAIAVPAAANPRQLAASAGLSPEETAGLTPNQIAQFKGYIEDEEWN